MRIIGITGKARSGKTTVACWAREHLGAHVDWFARPIKEAICLMFGLPFSLWEDERKEMKIPSLGKSPRELAQTLGTQWGREMVHPDCWLIALELRVRAVMFARGNEFGPLFIPDVRFENEALFVRERGGYLIHIQRNSADGKVGIRGHASEVGVGYGSGDLLVSNNGTISDLCAKLTDLFADDMPRHARQRCDVPQMAARS
jgi:hypothetical protein